MQLKKDKLKINYNSNNNNEKQNKDIINKYIANPNIKSYKSLSRIFNIDKKNNL